MAVYRWALGNSWLVLQYTVSVGGVRRAGWWVDTIENKQQGSLGRGGFSTGSSGTGSSGSMQQLCVSRSSVRVVDLLNWGMLSWRGLLVEITQVIVKWELKISWVFGPQQSVYFIHAQDIMM